MKNGLKVGSIVGTVTGVATIFLYYLLCFMLVVRFEKIIPASILFVAIVVNMIGALIYSKLKKQITRPRLVYVFITIGAEVVLSIFDWAYPAEPDIAGVACCRRSRYA